MYGECDGIEHVLPVSLLPLPVVSEMDTEFREPRSERSRNIPLAGPAIPDNRAPYGARRVVDERQPSTCRDTAELPAESWQPSQSIEGPFRHVLKD